MNKIFPFMSSLCRSIFWVLKWGWFKAHSTAFNMKMLAINSKKCKVMAYVSGTDRCSFVNINRLKFHSKTRVRGNIPQKILIKNSMNYVSSVQCNCVLNISQNAEKVHKKQLTKLYSAGTEDFIYPLFSS